MKIKRLIVAVADADAACRHGARSGCRRRQSAGSAAVAHFCGQLVVCGAEPRRGHGAFRPRRPHWTKPCRRRRGAVQHRRQEPHRSRRQHSRAPRTGDCFTVSSGSAGVTISAGVLVDTTDGKKAASGALHTAHRYIACENLRATITCEQTVSLLVSASASVTRFVDVLAGAWYADAVEYVAANGVMDGVGGRCFAPNDALTRAMFVTVLGGLRINSGLHERFLHRCHARELVRAVCRMGCAAKHRQRYEQRAL